MSALTQSLQAVTLHDTGVFFLDTVVKATALLMLACVMAAVLRRASAAVRHRVWSLAFCGLLALPLLSTLLPGWRLPILPDLNELADATLDEGARIETTDSAVEPKLLPGDSLEPELTLDPHDPRSLQMHPDSLDGRLNAPDTPVDAGEVAATSTAQRNTAAESAPAEATPAASVSVGTTDRRRFSRLLSVVWLLGMCLVLLPVLVSLIHNRLLGKSARTVVDAEESRLLAELCNSLRVKRSVRLLETGKSLVPMTWGVLRPIVLFPMAWRQWSADRRRFALLHELAHVKRCDVAFQLLARMTCALYWFHPLAWYALRRMRIERELACDDCVLLVSDRPSDYAQQLVEIARSYRLIAMPAAVAMASTTNLERRVRSMLDRAGSHLPLSRTVARLLLVSAALIVTSMAVVRPGTNAAGTQPEAAADQRAADREGHGAQEVQLALATRESSEHSEEPIAARDVTLHYRGQVIDPDGKPVAGAKIFFVYWVLPRALPSTNAKPRAITDADGWFDFSTTRDDFEPNTDSVFLSCGIVASANGFGFAEGHSVAFETTGRALKLMPARERKYFAEQRAEGKPVLQLVQDDVPIIGRVVSLDGQPAKGARVRVDRLWYNAAGSLDAWEQAAKDEKADFYSLRTHAPEVTNGAQLPSIIPDMLTDADGRFTLRGIGRERVVQLLIGGPGIETKKVKTRTRHGEKVVVPHQWDVHSREEEVYFGAEFTHVAVPSIPVVGRITDAETGDPLAGVLVRAGRRGTFFRGGKDYITAVTDDDGRYRLEGLTVGERESIYVYPRTDTAYVAAGDGVTPRIDQPQITRKFQLKEGIWVRGQAVDDRTGDPIPGRVLYFAFGNNPHLETFEKFSRCGSYERTTDEQGRFEIPVLPGPGVVTFTALDHTRYRRGEGTGTITGPTDDVQGETKIFHTVPYRLASTNEHILRQINPAVGSEPLDMTLALTSGTDVPGRLVDQSGQRLSGGVVSGTTNFGSSWYPVRGETFRIKGYYSDRPRDLFAYHLQRDLAGYHHLEGAPSEEVVINLQPAGSVHGRLVDKAGAPMPGVMLRGEGVPDDDSGNVDLRLETDENGRFLIRGLIPRRKYTVTARTDRTLGRVLIDVTVEAGKTKDVGDVTIRPRDETASTPLSAVPAAERPSRAGGTSEDSKNSQAAKITVRGTVLTPDGKPVAGATVRAATPIWAMLRPIVGRDAKPPTTEVKTSGDGQFTISFSTQPFGDLSRLDQRWRDIWKNTDIVAFASGYGPTWVEYEDIEPGKPITLKLVVDLPVQGRMVDLEARPVAGATVKVGDLSAAKDENLTPWLDAAKAGELPWTIHKYTPKSIDLETANIPLTVTTDTQGRFEIQGIGRDRRVGLVFEGENVAHQSVTVVTRRMEPFDRAISTPPSVGTERVYGAEFTLTVAPSRPIEGTVRDSEMGELMPGVAVESYMLAGYPFANHRVLKTTTDERGRFRMLGMPKGDGNKLLFLPNDDQPYFMRQVDVPDLAGLEPVTVDIQLHRGIWITGRVTDKVTGQPAHARLHYLPFRSNKYAQALPEFGDGGNVDGDQSRYQTKADGTFRLVGLPGRAIVGAESVLKQYRQGVGHDAIDGPKHGKSDYFDTYDNPINPGPKWPNVLKEINPPEDVESVVVNFEMDPGQSVRIAIVDPAGEPLTGVNVNGRASGGLIETIEGSMFEAINFGPNEQRTMVFLHQERNLGWVARVRSQTGPSEPITVQLQPCATVTGRLLDQSRTPYTGLAVQAAVSPSEGFRKELPTVTTDSQGRFRYTIVPGCKYWLHAEGKGIEYHATIDKELTVSSGETLDLGNLYHQPQSQEFVSRGEAGDKANGSANGDAESPKPNQTPANENRITASGRVLGPDGRPVGGAEIYFAPKQGATKEDLALRTTTGDDGRFQFTFDPAQLDRLAKGLRAPYSSPYVVARKIGLGPDWQNVVKPVDANDITLRLVDDDLPIEGRIVDLEGRPVADATVRVIHVDGRLEGKLDVWMQSLKDRGQLWVRGGEFLDKSYLARDVAGLPAEVSVDQQGRFQLSGIGRERVVTLSVEGPTIETTRIYVMARDDPGFSVPYDKQEPEMGTYIVYGSRFDHAAAPSRPVKGIVADSKTGEPIPGVAIYCRRAAGSPLHGRRSVDFFSDENGQYSITGLRIGRNNEIEIVPPDGTPYVKQNQEVDTTGGIEPLELSIKLHPGVLIRGRVTDGADGPPVAGARIEYFAFSANPHIQSFPGFRDADDILATTDEGGRYTIVGLPGRGLIAVRAATDEFVAGHEIDVRDEDYDSQPPLDGDTYFHTHPAICNGEQHHAVAVVEPSDDAREATRDIVLERGRAIRARIVGPDGEPLAGAHVNRRGMYACQWRGGDVQLEGPELTLYGLTPQRPRVVSVRHEEHGLVAAVAVGSDTPEPLEIRLQQAGAVVGRLVDVGGRFVPFTELSGRLTPEEQQKFPKVADRSFNRGQIETTSDKEGRFTINGLLPDRQYYLRTVSRISGRLVLGSREALPPATLSVGSGETLDLGDILVSDSP